MCFCVGSQLKTRVILLFVSLLKKYFLLFRNLDNMVLQFEGVQQFLKNHGWDQKDVWLGETASGMYILHTMAGAETFLLYLEIKIIYHSQKNGLKFNQKVESKERENLVFPFKSKFH
jgi:hypothetical protein